MRLRSALFERGGAVPHDNVLAREGIVVFLAVVGGDGDDQLVDGEGHARRFVVAELIKPAHAAAKIRFTADGVHRVLRRRDQDVRLGLPARHSASQPKAGKRRREQQNRARRSQNKPANVPFFRRLLCERRFRRAAAQPLHGEEIEFQNLRKALDGVQVGHQLAAFPAGNVRAGNGQPLRQLLLREPLCPAHVGKLRSE